MNFGRYAKRVRTSFQNQSTTTSDERPHNPTIMTNKIATSLFLALVSFHGLESSYAFQIHRQVTSPSKLFVETDSFRDFDIDLAEDCANNPGKYSIDEIELCRDGKLAWQQAWICYSYHLSSMSYSIPSLLSMSFLAGSRITRSSSATSCLRRRCEQP